MERFKVLIDGESPGKKIWVNTSIEHLPLTCGCDSSIEEILSHSLQINNEDPEPKIYSYRRLSKVRSIGLVTLRLVSLERMYGGPEEGGWWYDEEDLVREFTVSKSQARRLRERLERYVDSYDSGLTRAYHGSRIVVRTGKFVRKPRPHYC